MNDQRADTPPPLGAIANRLESIVHDAEAAMNLLHEAAAEPAAAEPPAVDRLREAAEYALAFLNDPEGLASAREEWRLKLRDALRAAQPPRGDEDGRTNEQQMIDGDRLPVPPRGSLPDPDVVSTLARAMRDAERHPDRSPAEHVLYVLSNAGFTVTKR